MDVTSDDDKYEYGSDDDQDQVTETEETVIDDINLTPIHPKDSIKD